MAMCSTGEKSRRRTDIETGLIVAGTMKIGMGTVLGDSGD